MKITTTNVPDPEADKVIDAGLDRHAEDYSQIICEGLCIYCRADDGTLIGGLLGDTGGGWLHIFQFWVDEKYRGYSLGREILAAAEVEAVTRGCHGSTLDTYSFQALDFYLKHGYRQIGVIEGYEGKYSRHFLEKRLIE